MKEIFRNIGILIALVLLGNLVLIIPDYVGGSWMNYGAAGGNIFVVLFGLIPIVLLILLDLDIISVYSLPFSDLLDEGVKFVLYISVIITSILCSSSVSSLTNAVSFIMTMFVLLFPLYLFYDNIVRMKLRVRNKFLSEQVVSVVFGGLIVLSIGLSYLLALFDTYLPGDMLLSLGTKSFIDGLITIPTLYVYSIGGCLVYFVYWLIVDRFFPMFKPKTEYKYATYGREYKACKNCQFFLGGRCELGFTERTVGSNGVICYDYKRKN